MASYYDVKLCFANADLVCYDLFYGELDVIKAFITKYFVNNRSSTEPKCYAEYTKVSVIGLKDADDVEAKVYRVTKQSQHLYVKGRWESLEKFFAPETTFNVISVNCISITQSELDNFLTLEDLIQQTSCFFPEQSKQLARELESKLKQKDIQFRRSEEPKSLMMRIGHMFRYYLS